MVAGVIGAAGRTAPSPAEAAPRPRPARATTPAPTSVALTAPVRRARTSRAIPNHAAHLMENRVQAMASAVLAIAGILMLMVMDGRLIQAPRPAILKGSHLVTAMTTATNAILALLKLLPSLMVKTKIVTVRRTKTLVRVRRANHAYIWGLIQRLMQ